MIIMTSGVYGTKHGMKRPSDGPFTLPAADEARLVARRVAKYVGDPTIPHAPAALPDLPEGVVGIPEYSVNSTIAELREIGKMCGLSFRVGMTKANMVAALDAHIEANTVEDSEFEDENADSMDPAEGESVDEVEDAPNEDAPTFDPAEAVQ